MMEGRGLIVLMKMKVVPFAPFRYMERFGA